MIQREHLIKLVGVDLADKYHNWVVAALRRYGITPVIQQQHWLAQVLHESGGFRHTLELASGEAYEGRLDLGNTEPGDGPRYKGRGLIQLTGRNNYARYQAETGAPVVDAPQLLEGPRLAADVAAWYWSSRGIGALFDDGSLVGEDLLVAVTRKINGGTNGLADRRRKLALVMDAMASDAPPAPPQEPTEPGRVDRLVLNPPHSLAVAEAMGRASVTGAPVVVEGPVYYRVRASTMGGTKLDVRVGTEAPVSNPAGKAAIQSSGMIGSVLSAGGAFALAFLPVFGVDVTPDMETAIIQLVAAFSLLAINGRMKADKPITGLFRGKS